MFVFTFSVNHRFRRNLFTFVDKAVHILGIHVFHFDGGWTVALN